ncbi:retropepsin-like aspartic protease family protein [Erythrobacter alti]|uniref:retropepsin-like aspartic protease family protein n=1 Tax=Erythrobacter alti TaxID=1896145 RepID=UPI0030F3CBCD
MISSDDGAAPTQGVNSGESASNASGPLAMTTTAADPVTWAEDVRLDRELDGHFYANVVVDGVPSRMLVDTGASVIALTGDDAVAMGIHWDPNAVSVVAQGASGPVHGVQTRLRHVAVGNFEARDVDALIIPEGLGISLLGQSFLSTIDSVAIAGDEMVLEN